ncbi:MAG: NfeD family protein [Bacteroidales bacterium]|jgi:membrane-bound ClpP family serine protease|nr:NfeD family protein [Bacteroidales bacterium]
MTIFVITCLILLGLLLLLIEFALIPGVTIAGIGGFAMLIASVYVSFVEYGTAAGFVTLIAILIAAPTMMFYFFKSKSSKKMILESQIDGKIENIDTEKIHVGDIGKSISRLAPSGKVKVNDEIVEAQSTGPFIDQNLNVRVIKIQSNKIIVELLKQE